MLPPVVLFIFLQLSLIRKCSLSEISSIIFHRIILGPYNVSELKSLSICLGCSAEVNVLCCLPFTVCGDECTGILLGDLARLEQMATSINLTGPLPAPYKTLYGLENVTQELKVGWASNSKSRGKITEAF